MFEYAQLGHRDTGPGGRKLPENHRGDLFGEFLHQPEPPGREHLADPVGDHRVVNGVGHSATGEYVRPGQAHIDIDLYGLLRRALASVDADHCLQTEGTNEYDVQSARLGSMVEGRVTIRLDPGGASALTTVVDSRGFRLK